MQREETPKQHKYKDRSLDLVGRAKLLKLNEVGYVEKKGRSRIIRGQGHVEMFFPCREDKKTIQYSKRVFLAQYAEYLG